MGFGINTRIVDIFLSFPTNTHMLYSEPMLKLWHEKSKDDCANIS